MMENLLKEGKDGCVQGLPGSGGLLGDASVGSSFFFGAQGISQVTPLPASP